VINPPQDGHPSHPQHSIGRHPACKRTEWWDAGVIICLERGADFHIAQPMSLPLTVSCFSKILIGFTFLVPAHLASPGQTAIKQVCVCVCEPVTFALTNLNFCRFQKSLVGNIVVEFVLVRMRVRQTAIKRQHR